MKVGEMAGVIVDSLEFCFSALISGTKMEGATLEIESVLVMVKCKACGNDFRVENYAFACPSCHSADVQVLSGENCR